MQHADLSRGSLAESAGLSRMSLAESTHLHLDLRKNGPKSTRSESGWLRDQQLKHADLGPTVKTEFCEFSCMRAFCL